MQGGLIDQDLENLSEVARTTWQALLGRGLALALAPDGETIPTPLLGLEMPEAYTTTSGSDWGKLDLGYLLRATCAAARGAILSKPKTDERYSMLPDLMDAARVVIAVIAL